MIEKKLGEEEEEEEDYYSTSKSTLQKVEHSLEYQIQKAGLK